MDDDTAVKILDKISHGAARALLHFVQDEVNSQVNSSLTVSEKHKMLVVSTEGAMLKLMHSVIKSTVDSTGSTETSSAIKQYIIDNWIEWTGEKF